MPQTDKTLLALGLCAKARKLIFGTPMICEAMRGKGKPVLVVSASDNSPNTAKKLADKCAHYGTELLMLDANGEQLASAVGKKGKIAAVAVTDENLSRLVRNTLQ